MSEKSKEAPKQDAPQDQEERWSLADDPMFHRSLPDDATEEEKADFIRHPWFYNPFAKDETYAMSLYRRARSPHDEPGSPPKTSRSASQQSTPEANAGDAPATGATEIPGSAKPTQNE